MAAKEHQGLQAAVIVFFMLTVVLGVTTYLYYASSREEAERATKNKTDAETAQQGLRDQTDQSNRLKEMLGFAPTEDMAAVTKAYEEDMKPHNLPEGDRKYRRLVEHLNTTLREKNKALDGVKQEYDKFVADNKAEQARLTTEMNKYKAGMDDARQDLENERKSFNQQLVAIKAKMTELQKGLETKNNEFAALQATTTKEIAGLRDELKLTRLNLEGKAEQLRSSTAGSFEIPDGKVSFVNQRSNTVYLNIGSSSGLRPRVTFSVYSPDQVSIERAQPKGSVEVINVTGPNMAEARIVNVVNNGDPILRGDVVFSPIWHHGEPVRFALAGFIDLDGDGVSDKQRVRDLIRLNGGVIDADVDDSGKVTGEITLATRFLIKGTPPTEKDAASLPAYSTLMDQAQKVGVEQLYVQKFLDYIGYVPKTAGEKRVAEQARSGVTGSGASTSSENATAGGTDFEERSPPE